MRHSSTMAPLALVTLRAHQPAPAQVELVYRPLPGRALRTALSLAAFWGAIPLLLWIPPHYPWVIGAFVAGLYLAWHQWSGRYQVHSFAGICPRCGHALSLGVDHLISLPHTLTCFHCHFEPCLEVNFAVDARATPSPPLEHRSGECAGAWELRWLADECFLVCSRCHAGCRATPATRAAAEAESERAALLARLTREGGPLI